MKSEEEITSFSIKNLKKYQIGLNAINAELNGQDNNSKNQDNKIAKGSDIEWRQYPVFLSSSNR